MKMKPVFQLSALAALGASTLAAQQATQWTEVFSDSAEVRSVDAGSVIALGDSVYRVWERSVSRRSKEVTVVARVEFDCGLRLIRLVAVSLPGFTPVAASDEDREWSEIVPGSSDDAEFRQVCGG